jgi:hypothetical protein
MKTSFHESTPLYTELVRMLGGGGGGGDRRKKGRRENLEEQKVIQNAYTFTIHTVQILYGHDMNHHCKLPRAVAGSN